MFLGEGNDFVRTEEFARVARDSGDYFVIVSREELPMPLYTGWRWSMSCAIRRRVIRASDSSTRMRGVCTRGFPPS